jgi:hypothetical protein
MIKTLATSILLIPSTFVSVIPPAYHRITTINSFNEIIAVGSYSAEFPLEQGSHSFF